MTERPILFSAPMIQAILAGKKTQTRRIYKNVKKVYANVGDILWVRENIFVQPEIWSEHHNKQPVHYAADIKDRNEVEDYVHKPSIHMPRWASRISLEVLSIGVCELQGISENDAKAEGVNSVQEFKDLWIGLNGQESWDTNPYVYRIEFEQLNLGN